MRQSIFFIPTRFFLFFHRAFLSLEISWIWTYVLTPLFRLMKAQRHPDIIPKAFRYHSEGLLWEKEQKKTHAEKLFCSINCINFGILNGCYFQIFGFICSHAMFIHLTKAEVLFGVLQCFFYLCRNFDLRPIPLLCINQTA